MVSFHYFWPSAFGWRTPLSQQRYVLCTWPRQASLLVVEAAVPNGGPSRNCLQDMNNWRPICMQQCIYKVYAALNAKRLATWVVDGCLEHTLLLSSLLQHSRRHRIQNVTIVWLDMMDAFGLVPSPVLFEMLGRAGLHVKTLQITEDIYRPMSYHIRTNGRLMEPIPAA